MSPADIRSLCGRFDLAPEAEITLETNALQITPDFLTELRKTPVNRLSVGLQSMSDPELVLLGRRHRAAQMPDKIRLCRDHGFDNISLDLIYGLPGSTLQSLEQSLPMFLELEPDHISSYLLTLEEDSPLQHRIASGEIAPLPDDDTLAAQYALIRAALGDAGYQQYEISNFARLGKESRHNLAYWRSEAWLGLGASAAGSLPPLRYANPPSLAEYFANISGNKLFPDAEECGTEQLKADFLMMGLRLREGVSLEEYAARFGTGLASEKQATIGRLAALGMLELTPERLRLTEHALFVSTAVIGELLCG